MKLIPKAGDTYAAFAIAAITSQLVRLRGAVRVGGYALPVLVHEAESSATEGVSSLAGPAEEVERGTFAVTLWGTFRLYQARVSTSSCLSMVASLFVEFESAALVPGDASARFIKEA